MLANASQRIQQFRRLPFVEKWALLEAFWYLFIVRVGLIVSSYSTVRRTLTAFRRIFNGTLTPQCSRDQVQWAVETCASVVPGSYSCLEQAIAAEQLLRRRGYDAEIQFGVDTSESDFAAHAWVESDGTIVVGADVRTEFSRLE